MDLFRQEVVTMGGNGARVHLSAILLVCLSSCLAVQGDSYADDLKPYPLPPAARDRIESLAAGSDLLILGECHGTREVPELVASLLPRLNEQGYHNLALEVPSTDQASLMAWARGETTRIPDFFTHPSGDGRGNAQLLELVRIAVSPPFRWRIVCFDDPESILDQRQQALIQKKRAGKTDKAQLIDDDVIADWRQRDAAMASNLLRETKSLKSTNKVLAICGNLHARTTNDTREPILSKLWPSFAGIVKEGRPARRVRSVNVEFSSGAFFNDGKVQTIKGRSLEQAEIRSAGQTGFDLVLRLPKASPATFLSRIHGSPKGGAARLRTGDSR
jgi:hypothetical protein